MATERVQGAGTAWRRSPSSRPGSSTWCTPTPWLPRFAISSPIENENGTCRVYHPIEFAPVTTKLRTGTYAALRLSTISTVREMRAVPHDLHAEVIDGTHGVDAIRRRSRARTAAAVVRLAPGVLLGDLARTESP